MPIYRTAGRDQKCSGHGHSGSRPFRAFWLFLLFLSLMGAVAQSDSPSEYQVKAAFLYNFGKFVEWPSAAFASPAAPFVIGIYGGDPFQGDLDRIVAGKSIDGHPVAVQVVTSVAALKECNIVFLSNGHEKRMAEIAAALGGANVLTVTENMKHFSDSGFMINFIVTGDHIGFQINNAAARRAGLAISSKLLSLARPPD